MGRRDLPHVIDDQDFVGQIEDEIALVLRPRQAQLHRLELEDEIVAERAVEPEMLVLGTAEKFDRAGAGPRKPTAGGCGISSGKRWSVCSDLAGDAVVADRSRRELRPGRRALSAIGRQQHAAALVQRLDREPAAARGKDQRRIDKAHVPARVTAGKLEARRKQYAALLVEGVGESGIGGLVLATRDLALDADAASRLIADALH